MKKALIAVSAVLVAALLLYMTTNVVSGTFTYLQALPATTRHLIGSCAVLVVPIILLIGALMKKRPAERLPSNRDIRVDVYGRFQLDIARENERWVAYRLEPGKRIRLTELAIPSSLEADEIAQFLDDLYHEMSGPGQSVRVLPN